MIDIRVNQIKIMEAKMPQMNFMGIDFNSLYPLVIEDYSVRTKLRNVTVIIYPLDVNRVLVTFLEEKEEGFNKEYSVQVINEKMSPIVLYSKGVQDTLDIDYTREIGKKSGKRNVIKLEVTIESPDGDSVLFVIINLDNLSIEIY